MIVNRQQSVHLDFFRQQRNRRQRSWLLFGLFLLVVLAHLAVTLGIAWFIMWLTGGVYAWVIAAIVIWILGSFLFGSVIEYQRLKAGGRAVARRVGAVRLFIDQSYDALPKSSNATQDKSISKVRFSAWQIAVKNERDFPPVYRRYFETAQQMAIAAGIPLPLLYVLPNELGINSFVAGRDPKDTVLVVTEGALEKLDDEALYGLIAHEMSHILQGDAQFNLQLLVLLAGLQLIYDWSDPLETTKPPQYLPSQRGIDAAARKTELETAQFTTHSEWVNYWQARSVPKLHSSNLVIDSSKPSSMQIWQFMLHGLSFSSMACAQFIKRSFNRERELLADATSIQLTRSPAVMATLKAIAEDPIGSRLTSTAEIHGLSHFFFASSGLDLGDSSWFATHPSLMTRMQAIDLVESQKFYLQKQRAQQKNHQQIKAIYEQRRLGDWGVILAQASKNSLSNSNLNKNQLNPNINKVDEQELTFEPTHEVIINGRLQTDTFSKHYPKSIDPSAAPLDVELNKDCPVTLQDINRTGLSQNILDHLHHPLGAIAVIEMAMLCHQNHVIEMAHNYSLGEIWQDSRQSAKPILAHPFDKNLLISVARHDRRLDSALIMSAVGKLQKMDISSQSVEKLHQISLESHSHQDAERYFQQKKAHEMALRYKNGLLTLVKQQLIVPLTCEVAAWLESSSTDENLTFPKNDRPMLPLWQALHLSAFYQALIQALGEDSGDFDNLLQTAIDDILHQLDPSNDILTRLPVFEQTMVILSAFALSKQLPRSTLALKQELPEKIKAFRRYLRLMSVSFDLIEDATLQWLLLVAAKLNSSQLLAVICFPSFHQSSPKIAYNRYSNWLGTLHTLMLHDTIITQDEFDCLTLLALRWVGKPELF